MMRDDSTRLLDRRILVVAVVFGCAALATILAEFHVRVPGTNSVTDPREIFVLIGAALTGPVGGAIIGVLSALGDPNADARLYIIASHVVGAVWMGWAYKRLVHDRLLMPQLLVGWMVIVFVYYFLAPLPVMIGTKFFLPAYFAGIVPEPRSLVATLMVFYRGWLVECVLSTLFTSAVLLVLPRRARSPMWWTPRYPRVVPDHRVRPPRNIIALRLTFWVLILSCVPLVIMAFFLRTTLTQLYVEQVAEDELEILTAFVGSTTSDSAVVKFIRDGQLSFSDPANRQFVLDEAGRLAWHPDSTALYADARGVFGKTMIDEVLARKSGYYYDEAHGRCYLYARLHDQPRWVVVAMDVGLTTARLKRFERLTLLQLGLALLLVAVVAGAVIWLIIGRPMRLFATAARRVGRNDLEARVDPIIMSDEVALLGEAFNEMTEHLGILHRGLQTEIEDRRATESALRKSERKFRELADLLPQTIFEADLSGRFLFYNRATAAMLGLSDNGMPANSTIFDFIMPDEHERARKNIAELIEGVPLLGMEYTVRRQDGTTIPSLVYASLIKDGESAVGMRLLVVDISDQRRIQHELQASVAEKELMLKEIHHRVKNNLQIISSLLSLQSNTIHDPADIALFGESVDRIRSMALIHDRLYKSPDLAGIEFREYIGSLVTSLFHSYGRPSVTFNTEVQDVRLTIDTAIPFGLITNELVTNALKHAFPGGRHGAITVALKQLGDGDVQLSVSDDGIGIPPEVNPENTASLGLQLVSILTQQLQGRLEIVRDHGTAFNIIIPPQAGPRTNGRQPDHKTGTGEKSA
jgi:PAS domain S-box-containing protein